MSRRFALNFTTVNSEMGNKDEAPTTDQYVQQPIPSENILINHGTNTYTNSTKHHTPTGRAAAPTRTASRIAPKHSQQLVVGPGTMRQFLASGGVGHGCSSCGGAK